MIRLLPILLAVLAGLLLQPLLPDMAAASPMVHACNAERTIDMPSGDDEAALDASETTSETAQYLLPAIAGFVPQPRPAVFGDRPGRLFSLISTPHSPPPRI